MFYHKSYLYAWGIQIWVSGLEILRTRACAHVPRTRKHIWKPGPAWRNFCIHFLDSFHNWTVGQWLLMIIMMIIIFGLMISSYDFVAIKSKPIHQLRIHSSLSLSSSLLQHHYCFISGKWSSPTVRYNCFEPTYPRNRPWICLSELCLTQARFTISYFVCFLFRVLLYRISYTNI